jgi:predicted metal-dependent hydrolase
MPSRGTACTCRGRSGMASSKAACSPVRGTAGSTTCVPGRTSSTSRSSSRPTTSRSKTEKFESEYRAGIELIRRGEYFAAHEELELAWRAAPREERDFFQGLVHVAVAWYQAGRGRQIGTERQLAKAIRRLAPYAPKHRGLDLDSLLAQLRDALQVAQAERLEHAVRIDLHPVELVEEEE